MTESELKLLLSKLKQLPAETECLEFKEAKNTYDLNKLGKYFSALSNEANLNNKTGSWLIFGINDKTRALVNTQYRPHRKDLDNLKAEIANKTTLRLTFLEIYELNFTEGRVIMFHIPPAPKGIPIAWEGHYYGRDGEELSPLNLEEIERIRKQTNNSDWSAACCEGATINDLDEAAISYAKKNFLTKNPHLVNEAKNWDVLTFLNKAKLTIAGKITHTAIILLGKPESEHFISPAQAKITWVLKDKNNLEKDYAHFSCPFIFAIDSLFSKIRILKYRYLKDGSLFPDEVDQYDAINIKEALSNCIAHQDYTLAAKINVVEWENDCLLFTNLGEFLPGSVKTVIESDSPPDFYRNRFLSNAMVNLNMIDTIGSGIKRMFMKQREKYFPMPDYDLTHNKVSVKLIGKVLDIEFARVLARHPDLTLNEIILLDMIQKKKTEQITEEEIKHLKSKKLIEGRKPNFIIAERVAAKTGQIGKYVNEKGLDKSLYLEKLKQLIKKKEEGVNKQEVNQFLLKHLPDSLSHSQKQNKISAFLTELRKQGIIKNVGTDYKSRWVFVSEGEFKEPPF